VGERQRPLEGVAIDPAFWAGRRVMVTGHTGFKGSWLCLWLNSLGARVAGYALEPPTAPSHYDLARVAETMSHATHGDIRDAANLRAAFRACQPEVVFHLAAQSLVGRSFADPFETFTVNAAGTAMVLAAACDLTTIRSVVVATSDKCYADEDGTPRREDDRLGGSSPYAASKACAEVLVASCRASGLLSRVATARAGNVIGGGDYAQDRLVPDIVRAAAQRKAVSLRRPTAVRPWQHVLEPLAGYLALAQATAADARFATAWNFGPAETDSRPVRWVAMKVAAALDADIQEAPRSPYPETAELRLNTDRARRELGWKPALSLEQAIAWTTDWYSAQARGQDARALSLAQIRDYARLGAA